MRCDYALRGVPHPLGIACEECGVAAYPIMPPRGCTNSAVACIVIANARRRVLITDYVAPSVAAQGFDDAIVVGDWPDKTLTLPAGVRYLRVAPMMHNTLDALPKRDVGTLATTADTLVYLNDDHALAPNFLRELREVLAEPWDALVPNRICDTGPEPGGTNVSGGMIQLNMGEAEGYCGGHAGVFRRHVIVKRPWAAQEHTLLWDKYASIQQRIDGAEFVWRPREGIAIIDLEPQNRPWL